MAAHQPNFIPYLGFFDKMVRVNELGDEPGIFVIRDDCQYVDNDFHSRNRIRINEGFKWIHVPVDKSMIPIREINIKPDGKEGNVPWREYHMRIIEANYKKTEFFGKFFPGLEEAYYNPSNSLGEFNMFLIGYLSDCFGVDTEVIYFSEVPGNISKEDPSQVLADIAKSLDADVYLSGDGGRNYIDRSCFENSGIELAFQDYRHPEYHQRFPGFVPNMSSIDALFNVGCLPRVVDSR